jgi:molybdopterin-guanine dinucleotide biosynthesis protein A
LGIDTTRVDGARRQFSLSILHLESRVNRRFPNLSGFVLVGGEGRRMGQPKQLLVLGGETLLERQLRRLRGICGSVAVVGVSDKVDVPGFPDAIPDRGPLGGIYTGLLHTRTDFNLFVGCDLPFLEVRFLEFLARRAVGSQADVTVPEERQGRFEPLCAIYRRRVLPIVRARLRVGMNKTDGFFHRVHCRSVPWPEILRAGFSPRIFANMNTPADYEAAKRILEG